MASDFEKAQLRETLPLKKKSKATETLVVMGKSEQSTHLHEPVDERGLLVALLVVGVEAHLVFLLLLVDRHR